QREQLAAANESLREVQAEVRDALGFGVEEALSGDGAPLDELRYAVAGSRAAARSSHSRHCSIPSPVRALTRIESIPGCTASRLWTNFSRSKSRCGSRSILLITTSSHARNMSGYLSGLSSPSVTDE